MFKEHYRVLPTGTSYSINYVFKIVKVWHVTKKQ